MYTHRPRPRPCHSRSAVAAAACVIASITALSNASAQAVAETAVGRPLARFSGEFSLIRGIRELSNGSVLVADPINSVLTRIDPALQRMDTLGRNGRGPAEYMQPDAILALPGDSSILVDLGNNRMTVVAPDGKLGKTRPLIAGGGGGDGPPDMMIVSASDRSGSLWYGGRARGDSLAVNRLNRTTDKPTRVATIKGPPVKRVESGSNNARSVSIMDIPMGAKDGWAVASTGALFIVRAADYHVEVIAPNGTRVSGPPTPHTAVPIGSAEKQEWLEERARDGGLNVNVNDNGSGPVFELSRARGRSPSGADNMPWPAEKPFFDADELRVDPRDRLWVRRNEKAGRTAVYDVFDLTGKRVGAVRLGAKRSIVGFGAKGMYVVALDDNDLQYLERYALPI